MSEFVIDKLRTLTAVLPSTHDTILSRRDDPGNADVHYSFVLTVCLEVIL